MVLQGGWFISPKGEVHEVLEHFAFVKANPAIFGLSKKQTARWTRKDRDRALRLVLSGGWIRVRDGTFETSSLTSTAVRNIRGFLKQIKAWPQDPVRATEHEEKIVIRATASLFMGKAGAVFARRKKLLDRASRAVRHFRTMPTNPFTAPTVVAGRGIFVPTGPPVVCSEDGDVEIDVPPSPAVLPTGQVFMPTAPPGVARVVRETKPLARTKPTQRHKSGYYEVVPLPDGSSSCLTLMQARELALRKNKKGKRK